MGGSASVGAIRRTFKAPTSPPPQVTKDSEMEEESFAVGGHQSGEVSEIEPNSKNPTDMDADIEVEVEEGNFTIVFIICMQRRFLYHARMEKWVLKTIGERWRQHKSNLKSIYYDVHKGLEANYNNVPHGVIADQWIALVNHWVTTKAKELLAEHPEFADTSQGKIAWNGDALNKILGEEKPGHVHGLGLLPNPNKVLDGTTSMRLNQLHVTSLDPTVSEDVLSLKLQIEKLVNHVQKQDATIQELQQKSVLFEHHQSGCLEDPPANQFQTSSKRKRVYVEPQNQEFRMDNEKSYSQREQEANEYKDLQPTSRNTSTIHKVLCYLIPHLSRFHGIMQTLIICIELKKIKASDARQGKLQQTNRLATTHKARQFELERDITFDNTKSANSSKVKLKEQSTTTFDKTKCATTSKIEDDKN
ncbi:hypothetical protein ZEAMMB73_Zm00001d041461 [Zea mays]|uniref:Transposase Tnp1/En/Spm-like domain-containing protein n=1 Tax=Zea mays TaxID=4577 RepID=A0A1D6MWB2_MAIZE|nr:hypothetical protein ZEAMMB73_Zm00001d041461 [Zea mays]